jgi:hypothetical protein
MGKPRTNIDPSDFASVMSDMQSVDNAVTAAVGSTQATGYAVTKAVTRVTVSAVAGDALTLPDAIAGEKRVVFNKAAANSIDIFPAVGDKINALAIDAAYALAVTKGVIFYCCVDGFWDTILTA